MPTAFHSRNRPISITMPPMIATARYVSAARIAPGVSSCATHVYEVKLMISKKMNVVNRSAERNTPTVAPCVSRKKK